MKSGFVLALALCSSLALAQQTKAPKKSMSKTSTRAKTPASTPVAPATPLATPAAEGKSYKDSESFKIMLEKLQIRYFGELAGSSYAKWDDNQVDVDAKGRYVKSPTPTNLFNQFSFRWKVGEVTRFIADMRFTTQFGSRSDLGEHEDRQTIVQEDHRFGFGIAYFTSTDKAWNATFLPRVRLPSSQASQAQNIILQPDVGHVLSFQAAPSLNFSLFNTLRYYWYEQKVDRERYRFYSSPGMTYVFNDLFELYVAYEHELQHSAAEGKRKYNYVQESLQDVYVMVNVNVTPSLTISPFARLAQLKRWDWEEQRETMQWGAWISGNIF